MQSFTKLNSSAAPINLANIDTDQIIPKQFLTTIERAGLSRGLFYDFRFDESGNPKPEFVLNQPKYQGAGILVTGANFGCGSSREHAPWALLDFGISCIIAPSFGDIFYNNCIKNGILPIRLPQEVIDDIMGQANGQNARFEVDLENQTISAPDGRLTKFEIEQSYKRALLLGLDDIADSLSHKSAITTHQAKRRQTTPWLA
jgi:3-isopropylmalate dehydratase small subunit